MLHRKGEASAEAMSGVRKATVLTNCPACVQGLGRSRDLGVEPQHIMVALAEKHSGPEWKKQLVAQAARATAVSF
jgi:D-lactate dehydrogenase (cytochrome)